MAPIAVIDRVFELDRFLGRDVYFERRKQCRLECAFATPLRSVSFDPS